MARDRWQVRWQARWPLASPHRLGLFAAAAMLAASVLWRLAWMQSLHAFGIAWRWAALAARHAFTMGFLGSSMPAMATRVESGQAGRSVAADGPVWAMYLALQFAVLLRGGAWFGRPRMDGRPGQRSRCRSRSTV